MQIMHQSSGMYVSESGPMTHRTSFTAVLVDRDDLHRKETQDTLRRLRSPSPGWKVVASYLNVDVYSRIVSGSSQYEEVTSVQ